MKITSTLTAVAQQRSTEKGAALITMLLITMLLLGAGSALILATSISASTTLSSPAEMQAYYAAEAGIEATLNVLRGNVAPNEALSTTMSFRTAVSKSTSNKSTDQGTTTPSRLSRWLTYNNTTATATVSIPGSTSTFSVVITDPDDPTGTTRAGNAAYQPSRLFIQVTGFGPLGAMKRMQTIVTNWSFQTKGMFYLRNADDGTPMHFTVSNAASQIYTGQDASSLAILPTIGISTLGDYLVCFGADNSKNVIKDTPQCGLVSPPWFLATADTARSFDAQMKAKAIAMGRYFATMPVNNSGTTTAPLFTYVDGDTDLTTGAGLLVVSGSLHIGSADTFNGIIIVLNDGTGYADVNTSGGNNHVNGSIYVASYNPTGGFTQPWWDTKNGGALTYQYDSAWVIKAARTLGIDVQDISEY